jgi:hypothetical protein
VKCIHLLIVIKKYAVESIQFYQENLSYLQIIAFKNPPTITFLFLHLHKLTFLAVFILRRKIAVAI